MTNVVEEAGDSSDVVVQMMMRGGVPEQRQEAGEGQGQERPGLEPGALGRGRQEESLPGLGSRKLKSEHT